jgi:hypothetical protein
MLIISLLYFYFDNFENFVVNILIQKVNIFVFVILLHTLF